MQVEFATDDMTCMPERFHREKEHQWLSESSRDMRTVVHPRFPASPAKVQVFMSKIHLKNVNEFLIYLMTSVENNTRGLTRQIINQDRAWAARNGNTVYKYSLDARKWT